MDDTLDAVYGCLVGGAIGDALGAPVEGWPYHRIWDEYGRVDEFLPYDIPYSTGEPGAVTDDTTMRHYLCLAIIEANGRVTPDEFADLLTDRLSRDRVWITEEIMYQKLLAGMTPWETGQGNVPAAVATMFISPIGIINAGDPRQAYQDAYNIAGINQEGTNRHAAATVAAGVAEAIVRDATVDDVLETMLEHSSEIVYRAMDLSLEVAEASDSVDEFVKGYYDQHLDWQWPAVQWDRDRYARGEIFSASSLEIVPVVTALLTLCGDEPNQVIIEGASFGRDCDTIGTLCGNFAGALFGGSSLRTEWVEQVESANRDLFEEADFEPAADFHSTAERMITALDAERRRHQRRVDELESFLG